MFKTSTNIAFIAEFGRCSKVHPNVAQDNYLSGRVGHTAHCLSTDGINSWILMTGGANLMSCLDNYLLCNLRNGEMYFIKTPLSSTSTELFRYEEASILDGTELIIFGGANSETPLADVWKISLAPDVLPKFGRPPDSFFKSKPTCIVSDVDSSIPRRTQHSSCCLTEFGELVIFSGGGMGNSPIEDRQVHLYNVKDNCWTTLYTEGDAPSPRLGHLMLYRPSCLAGEKDAPSVASFFVHGGLSGDDFYDDLFRLDITRSQTNDKPGEIKAIWHTIGAESRVSVPANDTESLSSSSTFHFQPAPRAAHGGATIPSPLSGDGTSKAPLSRIFVFGGFNSTGSLNDLSYYDEVSGQWVKVNFLGNVFPSPRMDFAFTAIRLKVNIRSKSDNSSTSTVTSIGRRQPPDEIPLGSKLLTDQHYFAWHNFLFVHGGMNVDRKIFNDAFVICLDEKSHRPNS